MPQVKLFSSLILLLELHLHYFFLNKETYKIRRLNIKEEKIKTEKISVRKIGVMRRLNWQIGSTGWQWQNCMW